jgi:hypothetical protein
MRATLSLSSLILLAGFIQAQDPGIQAAQQASQLVTQASQQATNQALSAAQLASQNAMRAARNSGTSVFDYCSWEGFWSNLDNYCAWEDLWNKLDSDRTPNVPVTPALSVGTGTYSSPITVTIKSGSTDAEIYYTTDGWFPTEYSTRYTAPIPIDASMTLRAIAVSPWGKRSSVTEAVYTLSTFTAPHATLLPAWAPGVSSNAAAAALASGKLLIPGGMPIPLVFASKVSSKSAKPGDKIFLTLADDLKYDGILVASKGSRATAVVTSVGRARALGRAGEISFKLESLHAAHAYIRLRGGAAKEGKDEREKADTRAAFGVFVRGENATIEPGARFTASVASDTVFPSN